MAKKITTEYLTEISEMVKFGYNLEHNCSVEDFQDYAKWNPDCPNTKKISEHISEFKEHLSWVGFFDNRPDVDLLFNLENKEILINGEALTLNDDLLQEMKVYKRDLEDIALQASIPAHEGTSVDFVESQYEEAHIAKHGAI